MNKKHYQEFKELVLTLNDTTLKNYLEIIIDEINGREIERQERAKTKNKCKQKYLKLKENLIINSQANFLFAVPAKKSSRTKTIVCIADGEQTDFLKQWGQAINS